MLETPGVVMEGMLEVRATDYQQKCFGFTEHHSLLMMSCMVQQQCLCQRGINKSKNTNLGNSKLYCEM